MLPTRSAFSTDSDPLQQIKQLQQFRWGLVGTTYLAALAAWLFSYPVSSWPLLLLLLALYGCTNLSLLWLPGATAQPYRVFALAILYDLTLFTLMLALSGGAGNGLIALLLLPVAVSAVLLPGRIALLTAALAVSCYLVLALLLPPGQVDPDTGQLIYELQAQHSSHQVFIDGAAAHSLMRQEPFSSHLWQMAWAFALSAFFIAAFVSAQARLVRQKSAELQKLQQQQWQQEQMLAVATYAANAAHELATPLQNLTLLTDELADGPPDAAICNDLQQEVRRCQQIVQQLRQNAQQLRAPQSQEALHLIAQRALKLWLVSRPEISLTLEEHLDDSTCLVSDALAWSAALFNILDNAADAGAAQQQPRLHVRLHQLQQHFWLEIEDFGAGVPAKQLAELGKVPQRSPAGLGLGQFLANSSIERLGGAVIRRVSATGGLITDIRFPAGGRQ
jgi:two-component system sensor histidine kinase RegB